MTIHQNIGAPESTTPVPPTPAEFIMQIGTGMWLARALWGAARYWKPEYVAAVGAVFIAGRAMYAAGYVQAPEKRSMGFLVSFVPVVVLVLATAIGAVRSLL